MALQTGFNITASDIKSTLEQTNRQQSGVRSWRQLLGNASLGASAGVARTTTDFSKIMADAYDTNLAQQNAILGAGLNAGATKNLLSANRRGLMDAYDTYIRNYGNAVNSVTDAYEKEASAIDAALTQRAENFANVYNSVYDYLSQELYGATYKGKNYFAENGMDWLLTKDKKAVRAWDDIKHDLFTADDTLTDKGIEFFDQVMNARPDGYTKTNDKGETLATRGFDAWLSDYNPELREWWAGADSFNYTKAGTNKGTGNVLLGRESTDDIYHSYDYLKGDEIKKYTSAALTNMSTTLNTAKQTFDSYKFEEENSDNPAFSSWLDMFFGDDLVSKEKEAVAAWTNYQSSVNTFNADFVTYLQNKLGSEQYADFYDEYSSLYTEYESAMNALKTSKMYDAKLVSNVNAWREKLFAAADEFVGKRTGAKKASGF